MKLHQTDGVAAKVANLKLWNFRRKERKAPASKFYATLPCLYRHLASIATFPLSPPCHLALPLLPPCHLTTLHPCHLATIATLTSCHLVTLPSCQRITSSAGALPLFNVYQCLKLESTPGIISKIVNC